MSYYTLAVYVVSSDGKRVREIVDTKLSMPFHIADSWAARLNGQYGPDRVYSAVNVNDIRASEQSRSR